MTVSTIHPVPQTGVIDSPDKPSLAATSAAIRALARAVDLEAVTVATLSDGSTRTEVSTIGLPPQVGKRIWAELVAGLASVVSEDWSAGSVSCRQATGLLLGAPVRVTATSAGRVAA